MARLPNNWRKRIEIVKTVESNKRSIVYAYLIQFKKGQTPKGFIKYIGELSVVHRRRPTDWTRNHVIEAHLEDKFIGRGLGYLLYTTALAEIGPLTTNYHSISSQAQKLWKRLSDEYRWCSDFFDGTLTVFPDKQSEYMR